MNTTSTSISTFTRSRGARATRLGEFEQLVLLAILRLGEEAYGVPIVEEIKERTGREASRAAVYVALTRLEKRGLVASRMGDPTPERGGKARRYFRLEPEAVDLVRESKANLESMWDGLDPILGEPDVG